MKHTGALEWAAGFSLIFFQVKSSGKDLSCLTTVLYRLTSDSE